MANASRIDETPIVKINKTTPGVYRQGPSGAIVAVVEATFVPVWRGTNPRNYPESRIATGLPQYAVERSANRGTVLGWCYSLEEAKELCRILNGGEAKVK